MWKGRCGRAGVEGQVWKGRCGRVGVEGQVGVTGDKVPFFKLKKKV